MTKVWYTVNVKSMQIDESGNAKQITDPYIVDAVSCTEAEAIVTKNLEETMRDVDYTIEGIIKTKIADIFEYHEDNDYYYKFKISYSDLDASSGKEKKVTQFILVSANDLSQALHRLEDELSTMLVPCKILKAEETNIRAVYHYQEREPEYR